jgi:nitrite reductase (NADH) small subunit
MKLTAWLPTKVQNARSSVARWVRMCGVDEAPKSGGVMEAETEGIAVCLANVNGELSALDNWCPHRRGPLGAGWIDGESVVCPWHSWTFNLKTGIAEYPVHDRVTVFPVRVESGDILIQIEAQTE